MKTLTRLLFYFTFIVFAFNYSFGQTASVKFEVKIPSESSKQDTNIFLTGSFNCWNAHDSSYIMKKTGDDLYSVAIPVFEGKKYEYKYTQGNWNSEEVAADGTELKNRKMISRDGLVLRDTVLKWKSSQSAVQKDTSLRLSAKQLDELTKIKEEMGNKLASRMNNVNDFLKKATENMLSENPDTVMREKYHDELAGTIAFALKVAADAMWKTSSILTPAQKKAILEEMKKPDAPGDIFGLVSKVLDMPGK